MWQGGSLSKFAVHPIAGAVAGGFLGLLQSWVLSRVLGSPPGTRWVAINAGLYAFSWTMTPLVWKGLISWLEWEMGAVMIYWTGYLALISGGKAAVAGVVLGRILRRSATSPPRASLPSG
jgi:hypothetical protein